MKSAEKTAFRICCFSIALAASCMAGLPRLDYANPVVDRDMPDPDATTADGKTFYLVTSSFTDVPGLPICRSTDLVHWTTVNHALRKGDARWTRAGQGVWAPAMRVHDGRWHIFWGDPDAGIYRVTAADPEGVWSEPELVRAGRGLIDPCPWWDEKGELHLVNAFAASRTGFNSVLAIDGRIVYDGIPDGNHTVEGPKLYRRGDWFWIFAPAGGVEQGWQLALRSRNLYGPYECRTVLRQGRTAVNGPHQGAWVRKADGTDWFLHFQDKGYLGRVLWLQPMVWGAEDWPVLGLEGEPFVGEAKNRPACDLSPDWSFARTSPLENTPAAPRQTVYATPTGCRLYSDSLMTTKFPAAEFEVAYTIVVWQKSEKGPVGSFGVFGGETETLDFDAKDGADVDCGAIPAKRREIRVSLRVEKGGRCHLEVDGQTKTFLATKGVWQAAKYGFCLPSRTGTSDWIDVRDVKFEK